MKTHTIDFKNKIKEFGRELDSKITYTLNNEEIILDNENINAITPVYEGNILKSVMKQLDIDSNIDIPINTVVSFSFGVKVRDNEVEDYRDNYDYINFGNYIVFKSEKQEDTQSYKITCYDKMLNSMKDYVDIGITYPITVRNYINAICIHLGLTFKNASDTFANYNKEIAEELYLDSDGNSMGYTFRDVLDELAQVTASTICINEVDDELEIRYINNTNDTIDEEYLKNVNVNFGESYGPVNTIIFSRTNGIDKIALSNPQNLPDEDKIAVEISDNQILNNEDWGDYLQDILNKLYGLQYYINDFASTGICYYNLCDRYSIKIDENTYNCIMLNDEINITQGLEENIHTERLEVSATNYKYVTKEDKAIREASIIINKKIGEVDIRGKTINIEADNIGIVSSNWSITPDGEMTAKKGTIGGYKIDTDKLYAETFGDYDFTQADVDKLVAYIMDPVANPLTPEEIEKYDLDGSGNLSITDVVLMMNYISWGVDTTHSAKILMNTGKNVIDNCYVLEDGNGNKKVEIGFGGIKYNGMTFGYQEILWDDTPMFMQAGQTANLQYRDGETARLSEQPHGIVIVWSAYSNDSPQDYDWVCHFVPKEYLNIYGTGNGMSFMLNSPNFTNVGSKYLYIGDTSLSGHSSNRENGTASGITYNNRHWVLRYVIGV